MTATSGYRCGNDERGIYCSGILDDDLVCPECGWDGKKFIADKIHPLAKKYIILEFLKQHGVPTNNFHGWSISRETLEDIGYTDEELEELEGEDISTR